MKYKKLYFSGHATMQMFKRGIQVEDVEHVVKTGKIIKEYPEDKPYPSFLLFAIVNKRPLHIAASIDTEGNSYVIKKRESYEDLISKDVIPPYLINLDETAYSEII